MDDPDRQAAIQAVREAAEAQAADRAGQQRQRDDVTARARAAGWSTGPAPWVYAGVVTVGVLANLCGLVFGRTGGTHTSWLLLGLAPPVVFILLDLRRGPLPKAHEDGRWTAPMRCGLVGAAAGLAAGAVVHGIQAQHQGCEPQSLGDCGFGMLLFAMMAGPFLAVVVTAAALALLRVRHAFFVAVLGVLGFAMVVSLLASIVPQVARHAIPVSAVAGGVAYAVAGAAHARNLSPARRCAALIVVIALPLVALALDHAW
ncbi:MAG TPA: hypothetical protein VF755_30250 [Catenuloplanes sp.]